MLSSREAKLSHARWYARVQKDLLSKIRQCAGRLRHRDKDGQQACHEAGREFHEIQHKPAWLDLVLGGIVPIGPDALVM